MWLLRVSALVSVGAYNIWKEPELEILHTEVGIQILRIHEISKRVIINDSENVEKHHH